MRHIPDAKPLTWKGDLAAKMVAGINTYLDRATKAAVASRPRRSPAAARKELARLIGVVDERAAPSVRSEMPMFGSLRERGCNPPAHMLDATVLAMDVRWDVFTGVEGEGLMLMSRRCPPAGPIVIAVPDADQTPEMIAGITDDLPAEAQFARRLAEAGCTVLVPTLVNRDCEHSGVAGIMTNQPHREFIYRAAYELGRHIIGLEVQKVLAAVDWLEARADKHPLGIIGYGEGGLIALYAAALDPRLDVACVSGYFGPRERLFEEPIYRNTWRLLRDFGDAEIAALVAPRQLIVEHCPFPEVSGPPPVTEGRSGAAPGKITTPPLAAVKKEIARIPGLLGRDKAPVTLVEAPHAGSDAALTALLGLLGWKVEAWDLGAPPRVLSHGCADARLRQYR